MLESTFELRDGCQTPPMSAIEPPVRLPAEEAPAAMGTWMILYSSNQQ